MSLSQELKDLQTMRFALEDLKEQDYAASPHVVEALLRHVMRLDARLDLHVHNDDLHMPGVLDASR